MKELIKKLVPDYDSTTSHYTIEDILLDSLTEYGNYTREMRQKENFLLLTKIFQKMNSSKVPRVMLIQKLNPKSENGLKLKKLRKFVKNLYQKDQYQYLDIIVSQKMI